MDAALQLKKFALFLAPALLLATTASAQLQVSQSQVTLTTTAPVSVHVTSSGTTPISFTAARTSGPDFLNFDPSGTTPTDITFSLKSTSCLSGNPPTCTGQV